jgi:4-hydroxy-3-methylbut-2-enyl diphosphate reductase
MAERLVRRRDADQSAPALYTYGPLIHNMTVLRTFEQKNVNILKNSIPTNLHGAMVIIRAHGVSPQVEAELQEAGAVIKDATCPKVKANQLLAQKLCMKNADFSSVPVFLAGDRRHAEIQGILGYAPACICISNDTEAAEIAQSRVTMHYVGSKEEKNKAVLIGQTTFPIDDYRKIAAVLQKYYNLDVKETICPATACRQDALRKLCASVDAMIIAGGKDSANTRALADIARNKGVPAYLIESAAEVKEIEPELATYHRIGLAAGASTPRETVDAIEAAVSAGKRE